MVAEFGIKAPDDLKFNELQLYQTKAISFVNQNDQIDGHLTYLWALWPLDRDFRNRERINNIREFQPTADYLNTMREILDTKAIKKASNDVNNRIRAFAEQFTSNMEGYTLNAELKAIAQRWKDIATKATFNRNDNKFIYTYPE